MTDRLNAETGRLLAELVDASRSLGADPQLVLHGGGNTSVKASWLDVTGEELPALFIKGSGHNLATIDSDGFTPMDLTRLRRLLPPTELTPDDLAEELRRAMFSTTAPRPSVETLVHTLLPHTAVLHSHADAILAVTNTPEGRSRITELFGDRVLVVGYAMPGPELAAACVRAWDEAAERQGRIEGLVVLQHGLFTVGDTPAEALERHLRLVALAGAALPHPGPLPCPETKRTPAPIDIARLRFQLSRASGRPLVLRTFHDEYLRSAASDPALIEALSRGPLTPDHVLFTGPFPQIGSDAEAHVAAYRAYLEQGAAHRGEPTPESDPSARVVVLPGQGMLTAGRNAREAAAARDILRHTVEAVRQAEALSSYQPADRQHVYDLDQWPAQRQKKATGARDLSGQVVLVTGAASGIGKACAEQLLAEGACVVGWDVSDAVVDAFDSPEWLGLVVDITAPGAQSAALRSAIETFGGLDALVVSAGIFPAAQHLDELDPAVWRRTMEVNVDSVAELYGLVRPYLALGPEQGRVVVIASKNVAAPGPGAAAYSASKAALTQLSRVAALEWAGDGIRVNMIHPDAIFDTALWTPELLKRRADHYGLSVEEYKRRNLLRVELTSADVARMTVAMIGETFQRTTGAQVTLDGGNNRTL